MAQTFANLPGVISTLRDGGLQITNTGALGDSLLIIGTSEKGPINEPVAVDSIDEAIDVFGSIAKGTLVRAIFEADGASQGQSKDIRGMRIGPATKASLYLQEASASGTSATFVDDPTLQSNYLPIQDAILIEALDEGEQYNSFTIRTDFIAGNLSVVVFNPITNVESVYTYSSIQSAPVDIHDSGELVDAINSDSNLNPYIKATLKELTATYEVDVMRTGASNVMASGVTLLTGGLVTIDLSTRLDTFKVGSGPGGAPSGVHDVTAIPNNLGTNIPSAGNELIELLDVYGIEFNTDASGNFTQELVESRGRREVTLAHVPLSRFSGINAGYTGNTLIKLNGASFTTTTVKKVVVSDLVGTAIDGTQTIYTFDADTNFDSTTFKLYHTLNNVTTQVASTSYSVSWSSGTNKITIIYNSLSVSPAANTIITASYWSVEETLTEAATTSAADAAASWKTYFVIGDTLHFGAPAPHNIVVTYRFKKVFTVGGDVTILDPNTGLIKFQNPLNSPASGILGAVTPANPYTLGFSYTYKPEWVNVSSSAKALSGGSNGLVMTNLQKYDALGSAFEVLENYVVDCVVLTNTYLDDTKQDYHPDTGLLTTFNAGFHTLFDSFLENLSANTNETYGIMGVRPALSNKLVDVNSWYRRMSVVDASDPTRAANIMAAFDSKFVNVIAAELIFSNNSVTIPYINTGEAVYGGLCTSLDPESAPTNKLVKGILGTRYRLSAGQLDTLTGLRYVTVRNRPGRGIVITDGITAAARGSDYTRLSTVRIVFHAMDVVRAVAEPFIGEPNDAEQRNALDTAVTNGLQLMVERGELQDFSFVVRATVAEQIQGIARVELILVPRFEMRQIKVEVKLRPAL